MDITRRVDLVMDVLQHAVNRDFDQAMRLMAEIAGASNGQQMYGVCCTIAEVGRQILVRLYGHQGPETLWALAAPDPADGPRHPAHTFSLRFITAFINRDLATCQALYLTAARASAEDYSHSLTSLVGDVTRLALHAMEERSELRY